MMETKAKFLKYLDAVVRDGDGNKLDGDYYQRGVIMRFKDGLLHGENGEAAIETEEGHMEYWKNGKIHADDGPAVLSLREDAGGNRYAEFWKDGIRVS
jgi:hypothetical protein